MDIKVAATILVAMYVISGLTKVASLGSSEAERLSRALSGLSLRSSTVLVFLAGVIELVGSYMILRGVKIARKNSSNFSKKIRP